MSRWKAKCVGGLHPFLTLSGLGAGTQESQRKLPVCPQSRWVTLRVGNGKVRGRGLCQKIGVQGLGSHCGMHSGAQMAAVGSRDSRSPLRANTTLHTSTHAPWTPALDTPAWLPREADTHAGAHADPHTPHRHTRTPVHTN